MRRISEKCKDCGKEFETLEVLGFRICNECRGRVLAELKMTDKHDKEKKGRKG